MKFIYLAKCEVLMRGHTAFKNSFWCPAQTTCLTISSICSHQNLDTQTMSHQFSDRFRFFSFRMKSCLTCKLTASSRRIFQKLALCLWSMQCNRMGYSQTMHSSRNLSPIQQNKFSSTKSWKKVRMWTGRFTQCCLTSLKTARVRLTMNQREKVNAVNA